MKKYNFLSMLFVMGFGFCANTYAGGNRYSPEQLEQMRIDQEKSKELRSVAAHMFSGNQSRFDDAKGMIDQKNHSTYINAMDIALSSLLSDFFEAAYQKKEEGKPWTNACEVLSYLLEKHFDINAYLRFSRSEGHCRFACVNTPLTAAIDLREPDFVALILRVDKAAARMFDSKGRSPLERVLRKNNALFDLYRGGCFRGPKIDKATFEDLNARDCRIMEHLLATGEVRKDGYIRSTNWRCKTSFISYVNFAKNPAMRALLEPSHRAGRSGAAAAARGPGVDDFEDKLA